MKLKKITYLTPPQDELYDCLDVFVYLENSNDNDFYIVEVTTLEFLSTLMENEFVPATYPYIIVSKLTDDIIKAAIQSFIDEEDDLFWLKLYHMPATLNIEDINEILYKKEQEQIRLKAESDAKEKK